MKKRYIIILLVAFGSATFIGLRWSTTINATAVGQEKKVKGVRGFFRKVLRRTVREAQKLNERARRIIYKSGQILTSPVRTLIKKNQSAIYNNPYKDKSATVRRGGPVSSQERDYVDKRREKNKIALEKLLGIKFPKGVQAPDIMFSLSGGGVRAELLSYAFSNAMNDLGLFDCVSHISVLSGSNWFLWPWLISGLPLKDFEKRVVSVANHPWIHSAKDVKNIVALVLRSLAYNRPVTLIDFYEAFISAALFHGLGHKGDSQMVYMDDIKKRLQKGDVPYPITTMVSARDMWWFSATPDEFGSDTLGAYVPVWSFTREFKDGKSVAKKPFAPMVSLGGLISMSSAAIAASLSDIYQNFFDEMKSGLVKKILKVLLKESPLNRIRFIFAEEKNPFFGLKGLPYYDEMNKKRWGDVKMVKFTDPGVYWGSPFVPLFYRKRSKVPLIMVVQDSSAIVGASELKKIENFASGKNHTGAKFPFPKLPKDDKPLNADSLSVLKNDDMLVLYFPRIIDKNLIKENINSKDEEIKKLISMQDYSMNHRLRTGGPYHTFSLKYKEKNARELMAVARFNVLANKKKIINTLGTYVQDYIARSLAGKRKENETQVDFLKRMGVLPEEKKALPGEPQKK